MRWIQGHGAGLISLRSVVRFHPATIKIMQNLNQITAVIVLYNTTDIIFKCLENLRNIKIIIVDNGRNNQNLIKKIKSNKNIIKYFRFKKNIGFGRACNFAFKYSKTKYTLLVEPDVLIKEIDILNLVEGFKNYPEAGVLVPTLVDKDSAIIDKLENLPELNSKEANLVKSKFNNYFPKNIINGDVCVNFCWAAVLLLNNEIIKKIGLFNKKIFIFWEDFYFCRKLRTLKIPIIKIYNSKAIHIEGFSTKKNLLSNFIINKHHILSSYIYFKVNKNEFYLTKKIFLYLFRFMTYLFILNLNKSLKNLARFCATYKYKYLK